MIRSFLVIVFLILFFIFSLIALPVEWVIGKFNPDVKAVSSLRIVQGAFHIILFFSRCAYNCDRTGKYPGR